MKDMKVVNQNYIFIVELVRLLHVNNATFGTQYLYLGYSDDVFKAQNSILSNIENIHLEQRRSSSLQSNCSTFSSTFP